MGLNSDFTPAFLSPLLKPLLGGSSTGSPLLPWQDYRVTSGLLAEWPFDDGAGNTVSDNSGNGRNADLTLPAAQSFTWQQHGLRLNSGLFETPAIPNVKTVVGLVRYDQPAGVYFSLSGGPFGSGGGLFLTNTATRGSVTGYEVTLGRTRGLHPLRGRPSNNSQVVGLLCPGWYMFFARATSAFSTAFALGGRQGTTTSRLPQYDIAYCATYDRDLTTPEMEALYLLGRSLLKERSSYLDYRDCPTQAKVVYGLGHSQLEGRSVIANLSPADQARTMPANVWIKNEGEALGAASPLVLGANQQDDNPGTQFGPEMGFAWSYEDGTATEPLYLIKGAVGGSMFTANPNNLTDVNRWAINPWNDGAGGVGAGRLHDWMRHVWTVEGLMRDAGIGPDLAGLIVMAGQNDAIDHVDVDPSRYQGDLTAVIERVREQTAAPGLKVEMVQTIDNDPAAVHHATIRAAEQAIAAADANVTLHSVDDHVTYSQKPDSHFDAAGSKALGELLHGAVFG